MTKSTTEITILGEAAIAEIEARANAHMERGWPSMGIIDSVPALCQTVRALRTENKRATETREHYERSYILPCFTWAEKVGFDLREAVRVNAGHNCVELLVKHLQSQLDQVTKERNALSLALKNELTARHRPAHRDCECMTTITDETLWCATCAARAEYLRGRSDVAISMRSACVEELNSLLAEYEEEQRERTEDEGNAHRVVRAAILAMHRAIARVESVSIQELEK